jgi:beta-lactamase class A
MASTFKLPLAAALLWQVDRAAFGPDARGDLEAGFIAQLAGG